MKKSIIENAKQVQNETEKLHRVKNSIKTYSNYEYDGTEWNDAIEGIYSNTLKSHNSLY